MSPLPKAVSGIIAVVCLIATSCNDNSPKNPEDEPTDAVKRDSSAILSPTASPTQQLVAGKLDTLFIDAAGFDTLRKKKIVFSFTFGQGDTLTMHGWTFKGGLGRDFDDPPNIRLLKGLPSGYSYGPGTYFGDLVLSQADVISIKKVLSDSSGTHVLFAPFLTGNHIHYRIFVSRENPLIPDKQQAAIPTNTVANPSPPKNQ
jgi:hypothetical protein